MPARPLARRLHFALLMDATTSVERLVSIPAQDVALEGELITPEGARGLVVFCHGSGSSRHSPRNRFVAAELRAAGLATLLCDLLTPDEDRDPEARFDIDLLTRRVLAVTDWAARVERTARLPICYFGASTGAASALAAAAQRPGQIRAVVSRGGRPDLARAHLPAVTAPTLLIVGSHDTPVMALNRAVMSELRGDIRLEVVPGATHLFEEPGALGRVAALAGEWFTAYLAPTAVELGAGEPVGPTS